MNEENTILKVLALIFDLANKHGVQPSDMEVPWETKAGHYRIIVNGTGETRQVTPSAAEDPISVPRAHALILDTDGPGFALLSVIGGVGFGIEEGDVVAALEKEVHEDGIHRCL